MVGNNHILINHLSWGTLSLSSLIRSMLWKLQRYRPIQVHSWKYLDRRWKKNNTRNKKLNNSIFTEDFQIKIIWLKNQIQRFYSYSYISFLKKSIFYIKKTLYLRNSMNMYMKYAQYMLPFLLLSTGTLYVIWSTLNIYPVWPSKHIDCILR